MDSSWYDSPTVVFATTAAVVASGISVLYIRQLVRPPSKGGNARLHAASILLLVILHRIRRYGKWRKLWASKINSNTLRPTLRTLDPALLFEEAKKLGDTTLLLPGGTKLKNIKDLQTRLQLRTDDVFVAGYPKSGTTWTQQIVKLIRDNGEESGKHMDEVFPLIDTMTLAEVEVRSFQAYYRDYLLFKYLCMREIASLLISVWTCIKEFEYPSCRDDACACWYIYCVRDLNI